uniref:Uncharacterized protein n=1 Tax=Phenylobacterium glaciei TaxID=2803784 RepID=A0A974P0U7_9CAUL|nr:hypothetical protein JKL49_15220 [Phenylobacterium glaciei]
MRAIWIGGALALTAATTSWAAPRALAVADMFKEQTVSARPYRRTARGWPIRSNTWTRPPTRASPICG